MDMLERAAVGAKQALIDDPETDAWVGGDDHFDALVVDGTIRLSPVVRAVLTVIREPISDAIVYLKADAEAWEKGADGVPHEVYLRHCGKLRRDVADNLEAMIDAIIGDQGGE